MPAKKPTLKPYTIIHHFPGGTKQQYIAALKAAHPADGGLPKGQIFHAAGPAPGGWTIIAIHESKKSWEQFRDGTLLPLLKKGIKGSFKTPPQESTMTVQNLQT